MTFMQLLLCETRSYRIGLFQIQPANCSNFIAPVLHREKSNIKSETEEKSMDYGYGVYSNQVRGWRPIDSISIQITKH